MNEFNKILTRFDRGEINTEEALRLMHEEEDIRVTWLDKILNFLVG